MADIWQQFHSLPKAIRNAVATPRAIAVIEELERQRPGLDLASFIMRVMIHELPVEKLAAAIGQEQRLDGPTAGRIVDRLKREVFSGVAEYLGLSLPPVAPTPTPAPAVATAPPPKGLPPQPPAPTPVPPKALPSPSIQAPTVSRPAMKPPFSPQPPQPPTSFRPISPPPPLRPAAMPGPAASIAPPVAAAPQPPIGPTAPTQAYSDEDAQEIARQAERVKTLSSSGGVSDFDERARLIMRQYNLAFSDELLDRRAVAILKARLKDIRQTDQTKEMLSRDPKIGGLGLDPDLAGIIATATDQETWQLKQRGMVRPPAPPSVPVPPPVPTVVQQRPAPMPPLRRVGPPDNLPLAAPSVTEAPRPSRPIARPTDIPAPPPMPQTPMPAAAPLIPPATSPSPTPTLQGNRLADRPTMADIRKPVKTLGPAEEMRSMSVSDWRRLGQGAADSAKKLLETFRHLQRESYGLWTEAVAGWRQSDVHQLYLAMGRESLERGVPISQVVTDRGRSGQPVLSEHEFLVISDFNRQLQV